MIGSMIVRIIKRNIRLISVLMLNVESGDCKWMIIAISSPIPRHLPDLKLRVFDQESRPATRWWKFWLKLSAWSYIIITLSLCLPLSPLTVLIINWWNLLEICCLLVRHHISTDCQVWSASPAVYQIWHHQPQLEQISEKSSGVTSSAQSLLVVAFMWPSGFSQFIPNGKMTGDCCWC